MNYKETLNYLFERTPMFQQVGSKAYKEGLDNTLALDAYFNHPHTKFRTIHVGGTNGKGSCSHTLAAILQDAGYKVGLYTSPHLVDFRERIRINGTPIPEQFVVDFVEQHKSFFEPLYPSFFELATAMAFYYFAQESIDVAIIEVGLGGRLDCTNIIHPDLSIITNISFDHVQFLGNTLAKIAAEKAGIIKTNVPVVIGETNDETRPVFSKTAKEKNAQIYWAEEEIKITSSKETANGRVYTCPAYPQLRSELGGLCQEKNTRTILTAIQQLIKLGYHIHKENIYRGFTQVIESTGLMGRWQKLQSSPTLICDTGHNTGGISYIVEQLKKQEYKNLHIVIGMVSDKDVSGVLSMLPQNANYYFTKASVKRALSEIDLKAKAEKYHLSGSCYSTVCEAVKAAQKNSLPEDFIFVGGSSFIVADLLANRDTLNLN